MKIGRCPSCDGFAPMRRERGVWHAICQRCGPQLWRAVFIRQAAAVRCQDIP